MFLDLFLSVNAHSVVLGLNFLITAFKEFGFPIPIGKAALNKLTLLNAKLKADNFNDLPKNETKIVIKSIRLSEVLLAEPNFRSRQSQWISDNLDSFLCYKTVCNIQIQSTHRENDIKSTTASLLNCVVSCLTALSVYEIHTARCECVDALFGFDTYLKMDLGASAILTDELVQIVAKCQQQLLEYLTEQMCSYDIRETWPHMNTGALVKLRILMHLNRNKLHGSFVGEICRMVQSATAIDTKKPMWEYVAICTATLKLFLADVALKSDKCDRSNETVTTTVGLHEYITQIPNGDVALVKYESWFEAFESQWESKEFILPDTFCDDYTIKYLSIISQVWNHAMERIFHQSKNGNIATQKNAIGAVCALLDSSNLTVSFMSVNQLTEICNIFFTLIEEREGLKMTKDLRIVVKNCLRIFCHIFSSSFCFYKRLCEELTPKLMGLIGEELRTNKLGLKNHFVHETKLQNYLLSSILKHGSYPIDTLKGYFENLRLFIKISLKQQSVESQKLSMRIMVESILRNSVKTLGLSQIDKYYFLFSLKYWTFDGFLVPSTEIFVEEIFEKIDVTIVEKYSITEFIKLFHLFFSSMLNFGSGKSNSEQLLQILDNTIYTFVDNIRRFFPNELIKKNIMNRDFIDDKDYFALWILMLIVK